MVVRWVASVPCSLAVRWALALVASWVAFAILVASMVEVVRQLSYQWHLSFDLESGLHPCLDGQAGASVYQSIVRTLQVARMDMLAFELIFYYRHLCPFLIGFRILFIWKN